MTRHAELRMAAQAQRITGEHRAPYAPLPDARRVLARCGGRCHGCCARLPLGGHELTWRVAAVPTDVGMRDVALCVACQGRWCPTPVATEAQPAATRPDRAEREERLLAAAILGLLAGWFVAGPAGALAGLGAGCAYTFLAPRRRLAKAVAPLALPQVFAG